jgi:hypothetical protein
LEVPLLGQLFASAGPRRFHFYGDAMNDPSNTSTTERELVLTRLIGAPLGMLFRCCAEPALVLRWFTTPPWKTVAAGIDLRVGGTSVITMQGPDVGLGAIGGRWNLHGSPCRTRRNTLTAHRKPSEAKHESSSSL